MNRPGKFDWLTWGMAECPRTLKGDAPASRSNRDQLLSDLFATFDMVASTVPDYVVNTRVHTTPASSPR